MTPVQHNVRSRCSFAHYQDKCEAFPRYLSAADADELASCGWTALRFYHAAATEAASQQAFSWVMLPKAHTMCHMLDSIKHERYNPRFYHNFEGENLIGCLKPLCTQCLGVGMEGRVLKRTVLKVFSEKEEDVARLAR